MPQYDVYRNPTPRSRKAMPLLLVLQADVVSEADSVIVAALTRDLRPSGSHLYPEFEIEGETYALITPDLASIPRQALTERVTNLGEQWDRITAAIDILFTGI
jgi:toxin CcdB